MMRLDPRHRRAGIIGGVGLTAVLALALTLGGGEEEGVSSVALVDAPARPVAPAPSPRPPNPADTPTRAAAPGATASLGELRLHGLTSGGAIIGLANGRQRLVRLGQPVLPGIRLSAVRQQYAELTTSAGVTRLTFVGVDEVAGSEVATAAARAPANVQAAFRERRLDERRYLLGLQPRMTGGRLNGYTVGPGAEVPLLRQAGMRPGDVLISINGSEIDGQERLTGIPNELAQVQTADIEFERNGRRIRAAVQIPRAR